MTRPTGVIRFGSGSQGNAVRVHIGAGLIKVVPLTIRFDARS